MLLLLVVKSEERSPDEPVPCSSSSTSTITPIPHYLGWLYWVPDVSACCTFADHVGQLGCIGQCSKCLVLSNQPLNFIYCHIMSDLCQNKLLLIFLSDQCYDQMIGNHCVRNITPLVTLVQCEEISFVTVFGKSWTFKTIVLVLWLISGPFDESKTDQSTWFSFYVDHFIKIWIERTFTSG